MSCYFSTGSFQTKELDRIVSLCIEHGLALELSSGLPYRADFRESLRRGEGKLSFLVHNYFPPAAVPFVLNLASDDEGTRARSIALCRESIDLCAELGSPFYSVHAGFCLRLEPSDLGDPTRQGKMAQTSPREEAYQRFLEAVHSLSRYAARKGVAILVENNVLARENLAPDGSHPLLLAEVSELRRFCSDIGSAAGLLLDTGHAKVSAATVGGRPEAYLEDLAPFIGCLHLSDNDGRRDSNLPISAGSWFAPFLPRFAALPLVLEVYAISLDQMLAQRHMVTQLAGPQF